VLVRKTVTVLFCDVTESTRLGETLDPETHRRVMSRYFEEMSGALEWHGGTVEKFIGDAVMAVFGVPSVHEDDALRALRAAAEMRQRLAKLNAELESQFGVTLEMRIGVNTGEVVAGDPSSGHTLVTGDAVVVAKRLEEAAPAGQILIGKATYPLVKDAVNAGPLQTFPAKGKRAEVPSRRVDDVATGAVGVARRLDAPLVDRKDELTSLRTELVRAESQQSCRLVTLLGPPGIGKSRLALELLTSAAERATTRTGRCLPYGDGITFWPLVDIVRSGGGDAAVRESLAGTEQDDRAADLVLGAVGASEGPASTEETFWGVRRYFEALARERPLVVCFEDIHWAEPTLLDLIDYLAGWTRGAPILLLCLARSDLLERRPDWSAPRENAALLTLEPLAEPDSAELLTKLAPSEKLSPTARARIAAAAEGNPLFLEQLTAMAGESPNGDPVAVPPSIQAVIAERLDRLTPEERSVMECAAVLGKQFVRREVVDLSRPENRAGVGDALRALVRKGLVGPDLSAPEREDGFRFGHVLIRDVAYDAMPKELRAELHERYPDWLEQHAADRATELEEIAGYHLEQAFRLRAELGWQDERTGGLAERAGNLLASAGRRALARKDIPAATKLLERAAGLLERDDERLSSVLTDLGAALREGGDLARAATVLDAAIDAATAAGRADLRFRAVVERSSLEAFVDPRVQASQLLRVAADAIRVFEATGDESGLAKAWIHTAEVRWLQGRCAEMEDALASALVHAEHAGAGRERSRALGSISRAALLGPRPVEEAIVRCNWARDQSSGDVMVEAYVNSSIAVLEAMRGRREEAVRLYERTIGTLEDMGLKVLHGSIHMYAGLVELISGDDESAERALRRGYDELDRIGERGFLSTMAAFLARALYGLDRHSEAEEMTRVSEQVASQDDIGSQVTWRGTRAKVLASRGDERAVELATDAVALARGTDFVNVLADALVDLAETMCLLERPGSAGAVLDEALRLYEAKGNIVSAGAARSLRSSLELQSQG
jgi:class 3 adenylate cyclase/tetratricopeptide (TPR) repeat protein